MKWDLSMIGVESYEPMANFSVWSARSCVHPISNIHNNSFIRVFEGHEDQQGFDSYCSRRARLRRE